MSERFTQQPRGDFDLATAQEYFGGWPTTRSGDVAMAFPVEGRSVSAAVVMRQDGAEITGEVHGGGDAQRAWQQALETVSLDVDGTGFAEVGRRDPVIGKLQQEHRLRPVLFHSPYEAACAFIIGHRITIAQTRKIRARMAEEAGVAIDVDGARFYAFPAPEALLALPAISGLAENKVERLHAVAQAALDGNLDRARLRGMPEAEALADLRTLPGVGEFFAHGILMRGTGVVDAVTNDDLTPRAVELAYELDHPPNATEVLQVAEAWKPYRMWALVLLHVWLRRQPKSVIGPRQLGRPAGRRGRRRPKASS